MARVVHGHGELEAVCLDVGRTTSTDVGRGRKSSPPARPLPATEA